VYLANNASCYEGVARAFPSLISNLGAFRSYLTEETPAAWLEDKAGPEPLEKIQSYSSIS